MAAPEGAPTRENVTVWAGVSASVAVAVNVYGTSSGMVTVAGTPPTTGARFTSFTWMEIVVVSASGGVPLSVTRTVAVKSPGPCDSVGVQVKTPVPGSIAAPAGAPASSENVNDWAGRSASLAVAVNV